MDQVLTVKFWHDQWSFVMSAPWVIIPLLLIAAFIGSKIKSAIDAGEVRALKARVDLAHDQYEDVVKRVDNLNGKIAQQDRLIAEYKNLPMPPARVQELITSNNEIKGALSSVTNSTADLGVTLTIVGGRYELSFDPRNLSSIERST
jgi:hypothetical protein